VDHVAQCSHCAQPLDEGSTVCGSCGAAVDGGATASFAPVGTPGPEHGTSKPAESPTLVVRKGPQPGERFHIDRPALSVGRDPESDIFLNDMTVSRAHANLELSDGAVWVSDAGSLNGTYVNGVCVEKARLSNGDVLQIGTFQMLFSDGTGAAR